MVPKCTFDIDPHIASLFPHRWYQILDSKVYPEDPTCTKAVLIKTAADQLIWAPIMTAVFFAFLKTMEGREW